MQISYRADDGLALYAFQAQSVRQDGPMMVLLHGGGPDHRMWLPLVKQLKGCCTSILPDIRGYGRSICRDPACHTWEQYAKDVISLLDHIGVDKAVIAGAGLGSTIALRTAARFPSRVHALVLISIEDIEDDEAKQAEIVLFDEFAERVRTHGIEAGWDPLLAQLAPLIGNLVREAIPRSDPESIAAAAAIGRDRSFRTVDDLAAITCPTLVIPGVDSRHPSALAERAAQVLPHGKLAPVSLSAQMQTAGDLANAVAIPVRSFLSRVPEQ